MMKTIRAFLYVSTAVLVSIAVAGCSNSSADGPGGAGGNSASLSSADRQAQSVALAELQKHWLKGADGWTTAVTSGSAYAPDHFLRQCRALAVQALEPQELSESDKLNGFVWAGQMTFKPTSCREAGGDPGLVLDGMGSVNANKQRGQWSQWVDFTPGPMRFQQNKAGWQFQWDGSYLRGTLPTAQDFANAGVR